MSPESSGSSQPLSILERRVLGVLVEKQKTTDTYPLTLNSIVTGCNQKSNRDPLLDVDDDQVESALADVQKKGLVTRLVSGRADKWKHNLYDAWKVNSVEIAILAELLLRGPQTEGELRTRASRMEAIADLETLRQVLVPLKERKFIVYLTPENRRGSVLTHGFHDPAELSRLAANQPAILPDDLQPQFSAEASTSGLESQLSAARAEITELRQLIDMLRGQMSSLEASVQRLQQELGIVPK
jgi:uncharacterized protein YceH (UPF0502 family)